MGALGRLLGQRLGVKLAVMAFVALTLATAALIVTSTHLASRLGARAVDASADAITREARAGLAQATAAQLATYDAQLAQLAEDSRAVARMAEQILAHPESYDDPLRPVTLGVARKGFLSNDESAPASVMAWPADDVTARQRRRLTRFSHIEPLLRRIQETRPSVAAAWTDHALRAGRYVPNRPLVAIIPPLDAVAPHEAIFYQRATPAQNPDQETVWTPVYRDPAGQGLMVTVATPFHSPGEAPASERFAGVAGLDVTLSAMVAGMVAARTADGHRRPGFSFLVDRDGQLIAAPRGKWPLLGLSADTAPERGAVLGYDLPASDATPLSAVAADIAAGEALGVRRLTLDGEAYLVAADRMASTGWGYVNLVPEAHALGRLDAARARIDAGVTAMGWRLSLLTVVVVVATIAGLLVYLQSAIVRPLRRLAGAARSMGAGAYDIRLGTSRRDELGEVARAFDQMAGELSTHIDTLEARVAERTRELADQARTDPLTGLANRRRLMALLTAELERSQRHGRPLAVLLLDLDQFKQVNDRHGHDMGDKVLGAVADFLAGAVRKIDTVARFGGEEMVVLLPETDAATARQVAERLRADLPGHVAAALGIAATSELAVTVSIGVAVTAPGAALTREELLQRADAQLYAAKAAGRNQVAS